MAFPLLIQFLRTLLYLINPTTTTSIRIAELCDQKHIPVLVITDYSKSSLLKFATSALITARSESTRLSILPILFLLEAIFNELGVRMAPVSVNSVELTNRFLMNNKVIMD